MLATHTTAQEIANARVVVVLIAVAIVAFWRTLLRVLLAMIVAAVVVTVGVGMLMLFPGLHL